MLGTAALPRLLLGIIAGTTTTLLQGNGKHGWIGGGVTTTSVSANPLSNPYIAYRTSPRGGGGPEGQETFLDHEISWSPDATASKIRSLAHGEPHDNHHQQPPSGTCHIHFALGLSKRVHGDWSAPIVAPPIVYSALPASGPGRQVLLTQYEHLDLLSPSSSSRSYVDPAPGHLVKSSSGGGGSGRKGPGRSRSDTNMGVTMKKKTKGTSISSSGGVQEMLLQAVEYPLLLEGSYFWSSPLVADPAGEGRPKAIVADSTGGIYVVGLTTTSTAYTAASSSSSSGGQSPNRRRQRRTFQVAQVPRLFVRREWVERRVQIALGNRTAALSGNGSSSGTGAAAAAAGEDAVDDPYHTYFEYYYGGLDSSSSDKHEKLLQGVSASAFSQDSKDRQRLLERRRRQTLQRVQILKQKKQEEPNQKEESHPGRSQEQHKDGGRPLKKKYDDDFSGDDLEYMLAKQRDVEERGPLDDEYSRNHQEQQRHQEEAEEERRREEPNGAAQAQRRRRLQEEGDGSQGARGDAAAREPEEQPQHNGDQRFVQERNQDTPPKDRVGEEDGGSRDGNREGAGEGKNEGGGGTSYDDLAADGRGRMNDVVDVDQQRATDDLIGGNDAAQDDPKYAMKYDDYYRYRHGLGDDTYRGHNERQRDYYDTKHYIRIPPHILCTPVLAELPKLYSNTDEKEDVLFVAVSYFLDEDEYEGLTGYKRFIEADRGDETEASRGMYVASAIMAYILAESARWMGQTHLDLSTDYSAPENLTVVGALPIEADASKMGAFALGSPTVADIDGDGNMEVLLGTSMGIVYAFDARQMYKRNKFPIQMPFPVESRILVEDVRDDTNLEIFVSDIGGNVVCLSHEASQLWRRNLATSVGLKDVDVKGSSPIALGDVNGDGVMDVTIAVLVQDRSFIFALNAATGEDLPFFPVEFDPVHYPKIQSDSVHHKLSQPLLVDLHLDQSFLNDYLRRNGTEWAPRNGLVSTPGSASGLHIVYPQDQYLHVIEAGSGCSQVIPMGDTISSMVQVDDVHGTNRLDLIVSTEAGNVITLESPTPYHPLNTWTQGELRGRMNGHAHGYSASQGIFVHEASRQYVDVFGVYVPITFEIFDNRPNIQNEKDKRQYWVEIRDGPSSKRVLFRAKYEEPGVYTDRFYIRYGPGFYTLHVVMLTSHGLLYEDTFHIGYNVRFMDGFGILLWLPLLMAAVPILLFGTRKRNWEDTETDRDHDGHTLGILGRSLPS